MKTILIILIFISLYVFLKLMKIECVLGQESYYRNITSLFYIYDDGAVENKLIIE